MDTFFGKIPRNGCLFSEKLPLDMDKGFESPALHPRASNGWKQEET